MLKTKTKNYILLISLCVTLSCNGQIYNINIGSNEPYGVAGAYYKDIDNQMNKYVGTWLYTDSNTSLTVTFKKITQYLNTPENYYEDFLVGEYRYVRNGVEIINTLPRLNDLSIAPYDYNLSGSRLIRNYMKPLCSLCDISTKRVSIHYSDSLAPYLNTATYIGYRDEGSVKKIILDHRKQFTLTVEGQDLTDTQLPTGNYVLIKQ